MMFQVSSDDVIQNIKKVGEKYQEVLMHLLKGKVAFFPSSLIDGEKTKEIITKSYKQFFAKPEKFLKYNLEYYEKLQELMQLSLEKFLGKEASPLYTPANKDRRFNDPAWEDNIYFDFIKQFYLMTGDYIQKNVSEYELDPILKNYLEFQTKQFINALSPSNFVFCNPTVLRESLESGWQNIVKGLENLLDDIKKSSDIFNIPSTDKSAFKIGENIAATEGKVIFQNEIMQLICYKPLHKQTYAIPIFIVPSWINKYYILDLSLDNSMVRFLLENNFQIFIVSWKNPDKSLANKDFDDYLKEGVIEPVEYLLQIGYKKINFVGYCSGGTMLAIALAYFKTKNFVVANSVSFLTTLLNFENPGEIGIFINESTIKIIEDEMMFKGYFDGRYLANSFSLLRANDLVWSFFINNYLLGKSPMPFDLLFWNANPTNLSAKMHSFYLRNMYLNNMLCYPGKLKVLDTPIDLSLIDLPTFSLAALEDHIAPWTSVYEGLKLLRGNKVFCLTSSGHVAGVVNPPHKSKYSYKINDDLNLESHEWLLKAKEYEGSWWLYWIKWLKDNSSKLEPSIEYNNLSYKEFAPGNYAYSSSFDI